jgi:hypothetical protein
MKKDFYSLLSCAQLLPRVIQVDMFFCFSQVLMGVKHCYSVTSLLEKLRKVDLEKSFFGLASSK